MQIHVLAQSSKEAPSPFADKPLTQEEIQKGAEARIKKSLVVAHILRRKSAESQITGLEVLTFRTPILYNLHEGQFKPTVEVKLKYFRPGWKLLYSLKGPEVPIGASNEGSAFLYLKSSVSELQLIAMNEAGETEKEKLFIYAPGTKELKTDSPWNKVVLSLGGAVLDYYQTSFGNFRSTNALAAILYAPEALYENWSMIARADLTFASFYSSPIRAGPQVLDSRIDLTYQISDGYDSTHRWFALGGVSYLTLFSNGSPFGFSDLLAPELGLRLRSVLDPMNFLVTDLRYVALGGPFEVGQRNLQIAFSWSRWMENLRRLELGLEYSTTSFAADPKNTVKTNLLILKLGFSI